MKVCMVSIQEASIFVYVLFCGFFKPCVSFLQLPGKYIHNKVMERADFFKNLKFLSHTPGFMLLPRAGSQTVLWHLLCFSHAAKYMLQNCHSELRIFASY